LGAIAQKKGNTKEAYEHIRKAITLGLPDKDNEASAYLQLCSICMQRRDFRASKQYFAKAKSCKATNAQIVDQVKEMQKYIARMPG
jgi:Flp pilus assembly protein TadD